MGNVLQYVVGTFALLFGTSCAALFGAITYEWLRDANYEALSVAGWACGSVGVVFMAFFTLFAFGAGLLGFCLCGPEPKKESFIDKVRSSW